MLRTKVLVAVLAVTACLALVGCGGNAGDPKGAVAGWVYRSATDGTPIFAAVSQPPAGYEAVAGAQVTVVDHPGLSATTDPNGYYRIEGVPAGRAELRTEVAGRPHRIPVWVRGGATVFVQQHIGGGADDE